MKRNKFVWLFTDGDMVTSWKMNTAYDAVSWRSRNNSLVYNTYDRYSHMKLSCFKGIVKVYAKEGLIEWDAK